MDILCYDGTQFPHEYGGGAFVALKGSWNRSEPTGYKVVFVPTVPGRVESFAMRTGWLGSMSVVGFVSAFAIG